MRASETRPSGAGAKRAVGYTYRLRSSRKLGTCPGVLRLITGSGAGVGALCSSPFTRGTERADFRRAAALELARSVKLLERLQHYRSDLRLSYRRLSDVAELMPNSHALAYALTDLSEVLEHLDHTITALEARES
jgi:hypothetical protein